MLIAVLVWVGLMVLFGMVWIAMTLLDGWSKRPHND